MPRRKAARFKISDVIKDISGYSLIPLDYKNNFHQKTISALKSALESIVKRNNEFHAKRANDISENTEGECLEKRIERIFNSISQSMKVKRLQVRGYPNLEIRDSNQKLIVYLEVKVTSVARTSRSSPRDFYISPGSVLKGQGAVSPAKIVYTFDVSPGNTSRKIQAEIPHLLLLFKAENIGNSPKYPGYNLWKIRDFRIFDLSALNLKLKIEFNATYQDIEGECKEL